MKPIVLPVICFSIIFSSAQSDMNSSNPICYIALGDSYTIGEAVDATERFPAQLVSSLRNQNFDIGDPRIIAQTGWTTDELNAAIEKEDMQITRLEWASVR